MDFKLGEFVRFVDEKREGFITKIFDETMVGVTGDDDFEIPTTVKNLTRVHGHSNYIEEAKVLKTNVISADTVKETGIYLAIAPDANKASLVHFYMVNATENQLLCALNTDKNGVCRGEYAEIIAPFTVKKVYVASLPELDNWPECIFRIIAYTNADKPITTPIHYKQKFKAKDFSGATKNISLLPQPAWVFRLDETDIKIDVQKLKESFFKVKEVIPIVQKPANEIDLHIEKLSASYANLSNVEIIEIQLNYFNKILDEAIIHKYKSIIFIHGVGNGTLKSMIHKQLGKHPQVKTFMDAHKEKFGYGATQVFFK
jgi:hypothetical protein